MTFWHPGRRTQWRPEFDALARYNAERWRGIVHTPEYDERMARLQAEFDATMEPATGL